MILTKNQKGEYNPHLFLHTDEISVSPETETLLKQAEKVYFENFNGRTWYGRCIFISWYCSLDDCTFCFRSTKQFQDLHPEGSRRSMGSLLLEALFCRIFNWRIEFLTGGYGIMPFSDLLEVVENVSKVYGEKVWLNLGVMPPQNIERLRPYVKGVVSSLETVNPELHKFVCPSKPIEAYERMIEKLEGLKKSAAIIVGLGEEIKDIHYLFDFVEKHKLDRVTMYALKPVRGTIYTKGPSVDEYVQWLARLRIRFPKLEIIAGTNLRRCEEIGYLMRAGVNGFTKFPATKQFGTKKAQLVEQLISKNGRVFTGNLTSVPEDVDWNREIDALDIKENYKAEMREKFPSYLKRFKNPHDKDVLYQEIECD